MAKKAQVLVLGDLVYDYNLLHLPGGHLRYFELLPSAVLSERPGNAWYQKDLVEIACSDIEPEIIGPDYGEDLTHGDSGQIAKAYSLWSPFDQEIGKKEKVWRVERFLGCHAPREKREPVVFPDGLRPDLMLIDDENLGFRDDEKSWMGLLEQLGSSTQIILKAAMPLGKGHLWRALFDKHPGNLTVLMSVHRLRTQYAAISEALSWDLAIEELDREFKEGHLAADLSAAAHVIVYFRGAGAASYREGCLERFVFHPEELEGIWHARRPGHTFGCLSIITAAVVRHKLQPKTYPLFVALGRALSAIRQFHDLGAGKVTGSNVEEIVDSFNIDSMNNPVRKKLHPLEDEVEYKEISSLPESEFRAAFPKKLLTGMDSDDDGVLRSDLLQDLTGQGYEYVAARAMQVIMDGPEKALSSAPKARYCRYLTFDREEQERINDIRSLILSYSSSEYDRKPLSIAVFGPPGSGKSFAIEQIAEELFGKEQATPEFNLVQFRSEVELHRAFHQVRDASLQGGIPLVFWDEFDTRNLKWLKEFLAPMQDAQFLEGGIAHPFGKAIFVFAGGVFPNFQSFDKSSDPDPEIAKGFGKVKGTDFVSRLRGYVNIKGPNPQEAETGIAPGKAPTQDNDCADEPPKKTVEQTDVDDDERLDEAAEKDVAHLIRRATLLRSIIQKHHPHLIDTSSGRASISSSVARAFLRVKYFRHGSRSLEAIVSMSSLAEVDFFGVAELPSTRLLNMHVTPDFMAHVRFGEMESETFEILAKAHHEAIAEFESHPKPGNPPIQRWEDLSEDDKDRNRMSVRETLAMLYQIGYRIKPLRRSEKQEGDPVKFIEWELQRLMRIEHERWLRNRLLEGFESAEETNKWLHLDHNLTCFKKLPPETQELNRAIVSIIPEALWQGGYKLVIGRGDTARMKVGVTGYQILTDIEKIIAGIEEALEEIMEASGDRRLMVLTSLEEGAHRLVAKAVQSVTGSRMVAVIPFDLENYKACFGAEGSESQEEFAEFLESADEIVQLPDASARNEGYKNGGRYVVDKCDVLVAVCDGKEPQGQDVTEETVERARSEGKPVVIVKAGNTKPGTTEPTTLGKEQGKVIVDGLTNTMWRQSC